MISPLRSEWRSGLSGSSCPFIEHKCVARNLQYNNFLSSLLNLFSCFRAQGLFCFLGFGFRIFRPEINALGLRLLAQPITNNKFNKFLIEIRRRMESTA